MRLTDAQAVPLSSLADSKLLALSRHWGRIGIVALRRFLATLPEILRRGLYRRCRCQSVFEYAAKFSTASREVVNDLLNVHRQIGRFPALWSLFVDGKVGLTASLRIAPRDRPETAEGWAQIASTCTIREIEAVIKASESTSEPVQSTLRTPGPGSRGPGVRRRASGHCRAARRTPEGPDRTRRRRDDLHAHDRGPGAAIRFRGRRVRLGQGAHLLLGQVQARRLEARQAVLGTG